MQGMLVILLKYDDIFERVNVLTIAHGDHGALELWWDFLFSQIQQQVANTSPHMDSSNLKYNNHIPD